MVDQWEDNDKDNEDNKDIKEIIYEDVRLMKQPQGGFSVRWFCAVRIYCVVYIHPIRRTAEGDVASVRTVCASLARHIVHAGE